MVITVSMDVVECISNDAICHMAMHEMRMSLALHVSMNALKFVHASLRKLSWML